MDIYRSVETIISRLKAPSTLREGIAPLGSEGHWEAYPKCTIESMVDRISTACEAESRRIGVPVVIAVVDASGALVYLKRLPHALGVSNELAPNKAYTAVAFRSSTHELGGMMDSSSPLYGIETMVQRPIVLFGGGEPLFWGSTLVGGLGISGGTVEEDVLIARAGLRAFQTCI